MRRLLCAMLTLLLSACGTPAASNATLAPTTAAAPSTAPSSAPTIAPIDDPPAEAGTPGEIEIFISFPYSGSTKDQVDKHIRAIEMQLANYDAQVCDGRYNVRLSYNDNSDGSSGKWDPDVEANNAEKAAANPDVMIYIGSSNSGASKIAIPILNRAGLVMISPAATYPGLTKANRGEAGEPEIYYPSGVRNFTRVVPADDTQGAVGAVWAQALGASSAYLLHDDQTYGQGIVDIFSARASELGITLVATEPYSVDAALRDELVSRVVAAKPDLVYFGGIASSQPGVLLKKLRDAGYTGMFMGPDGIYKEIFIEEAQGAAEGAYITFGGTPAARLDGRGAAWYTEYKEQYGVEPESYTSAYYESLGVALYALNEACTKDREQIRQTVMGLTNYEGVLGTWGFDASGDTTNTTTSGVQVKDGSFEFVKLLRDER